MKPKLAQTTFYATGMLFQGAVTIERIQAPPALKLKTRTRLSTSGASALLGTQPASACSNVRLTKAGYKPDQRRSHLK